MEDPAFEQEVLDAVFAEEASTLADMSAPLCATHAAANGSTQGSPRPLRGTRELSVSISDSVLPDLATSSAPRHRTATFLDPQRILKPISGGSRRADGSREDLPRSVSLNPWSKSSSPTLGASAAHVLSLKRLKSGQNQKSTTSPKRRAGKALAKMLDDVVVKTRYESGGGRSLDRFNRAIGKVQSLREVLKSMDVLERVVDIFKRYDTDGSGEIDEHEFQMAMQASIPNASKTEILTMFREFDADSSGTISYHEMRASLKNPTAKPTQYVEPPLPRDLMRRRKDVLHLWSDLEKQRRGELKVAPGLALPTFEECLRLYFPKEKRENINILVQWVQDVHKAKAAHDYERMKTMDDALIAALDTDGDDSISLSEFCQLSKRTGLSKAQMRARFRDKDFGNAGVLNVEQMREVLQELREENRLKMTDRKKPSAAVKLFRQQIGAPMESS